MVRARLMQAPMRDHLPTHQPQLYYNTHVTHTLWEIAFITRHVMMICYDYSERERRKSSIFLETSWSLSSSWSSLLFHFDYITQDGAKFAKQFNNLSIWRRLAPPIACKFSSCLCHCDCALQSCLDKLSMCTYTHTHTSTKLGDTYTHFLSLSVCL